MHAFKHLSVWNWLYSWGQQPLDDALFLQLTEQGRHTVSRKLWPDGTAYTREALEITWPVSARFRFCTLLDLGSERAFEEFLFLQQDDQSYLVAWFDAHNHERLFRRDEFQALMAHIQREHDQDAVDAMGLYLARYLSLIEQADVPPFIAEVGPRLQRLCGLGSGALDFQLSQPYAGVDPGSPMARIWRLQASPTALRFWLNENLQWARASDGHWALTGFAAHSLRARERMDQAHAHASDTPVDMHDTALDLGACVFPNRIWDALMAEVARGR